MLDKLACVDADKFSQLLDIFLRDADFSDAAAIGARGAIDLRFNLFTETAQTPIGMPVVFLIGAKLGVFAPLLLFEAADLD